MRDYGNMPKIDWRDDKPTLVRIKAQLIREEPVIVLLPEAFEFGFDAGDCGCTRETDMLLGCQPHTLLSALAEVNAMPGLAELGELAKEEGQIIDVDQTGRRLIIHD